MGWITSEDLRGFVKNLQAGDEQWLQLACDVAVEKVEELCGPIAWADITEEYVQVERSPEVCLSNRVTRGLVGITTYDGLALTVTDWRADGQVLQRRDHALIATDLLVSYRTGYYDDTVKGAAPPSWAKAMALPIAQQYLTAMRRFTQTGQPPTGAAFLVPYAALEVGHDYLLWKGGVA